MDGSIAYFVSSHGFGHAARACAVLEALHANAPNARFEVFSTVPMWFFEDSLTATIGYHNVKTDIGLVQRDSLVEDAAATAEQLDRFLPIPDEHLDEISTRLRNLQCRVVVCDLAPVGLAAANRAGLPSVLVENFTWDWIYDHYTPLQRFSKDLSRLFSLATLRIQTEPVCVRYASARVVSPVSRKARRGRSEIRNELGVPQSEPLVLVTMGGIEWDHGSVDNLASHDSVFFVLPGVGETLQRQGRLVTFPHRSSFYHPDLMAAADVVIGKLGYSTLAECYHAGAAHGYVPRSDFPESGPIGEFAKSRMSAVEIADSDFRSGRWLRHLDSLLSIDRRTGVAENGAAAAAAAILRVARGSI